MGLYVIVEIRDLDGSNIGFAVHKEGTLKLEDTNIWTTEESDQLAEHVGALNNRVELQAHWPNAQDPDVLELIEDPNFEALEYEDQDGVDQGRLYDLVQEGEIRITEEDGEQIVDPRDSHLIPTISERVLKDPAQPMNRYRKASEIVARRRLEASKA